MEWLTTVAGKLPLVDVLKRLLDRVPWLDLERTKESKNHDRTVFEQFDQLLSEHVFELFLEDAANLAIPQSSYVPVWHTLSASRTIGSEMVSASLERKRLAFIRKLDELNQFLARHVFGRPNGDEEYYIFLPQHHPIHPESDEPDNEYYRESRDKLQKLIHDCECAYKDFRRAVKYKLLV